MMSEVIFCGEVESGAEALAADTREGSGAADSRVLRGGSWNNNNPRNLLSSYRKCAEGVPFCGFRFMPGLRPRVLGATKRRFEKRKRRLLESKAGLAELGKSVFAWYQFSREGNSYGLRRCYAARGGFVI